MATRIILVRHGHVEGITPHRFRGREDIPLTDLGRAQARATARKIAEHWRPDGILTSPMHRCLATAAEISDACAASSQTLDALNDIDYGTWQWKTHSEMSRSFPDLYAMWRTTPHLFRFPQGESLQDLVARVSDALRLILQEHRDQTIIVVCHNSVGRALLMQILDQPLSAYWRFYFAPCGISEIEFVCDVPTVLRVNETFHLSNVAKDALSSMTSNAFET
jgi:broad specificity phosphatase PhoE